MLMRRQMRVQSRVDKGTYLAACVLKFLSRISNYEEMMR